MDANEISAELAKLKYNHDQLAVMVTRLSDRHDTLLKQSNDFLGRIAALEQRLAIAEATIKDLRR